MNGDSIGQVTTYLLDISRMLVINPYLSVQAQNLPNIVEETVADATSEDVKTD